MALVIETGSGLVAGANSYVTLDELKAFSNERGLTISTDDLILEQYLHRAIDYLEGVRERFQGSKVLQDQPLQWPREGVYLDTFEWPKDRIPKELKLAQCQLAVEFHEVDPLATTTGETIKSEKVDVIEVAYAVSENSGSPSIFMPKVDAFLEPLFRPGSYLRLIRI